MTTMTAIYLGFLALATGAFIIVRYLSGKDELLSMRNFFLAGFIIFQLTSGIEPMLDQFNGRYSLNNWDSTSLTYCAMVTVFLVLFLVFYELGLGAGKAARLVPVTRAMPGPVLMLLLAVVFTFVAAGIRLSASVSLLATLSGKLGPALGAIAAGLVSWVWAKRLLNPVVAVIAVAIIMANIGIQISGAFGRRSIVAIGACALWGMYYSHWRTLPRVGVLTRLTIMAVPPLLFLAAFTSIRASQERPTLTQQVNALVTQSSIKNGLKDLASGQGTVPVSLWLIENYPERFEYRWFMGLKYFFYYPVPRAIWTEKPYPLSTRIASNADLEGVSQDILKIGPGVVGHAAAEGGWPAVFVYGAAFAFFIRFFDQIASRKIDNAFVVLPVGSASGQIVGLSRGEISAFAMNYVLAVVLAYASIITLAKILEMIGYRESDAEPDWIAEAAVAGEGGWDDGGDGWYEDESYGELPPDEREAPPVSAGAEEPPR